MNRLNEAADLLEQGWCKNKYRKELGGQEQFCAIGALATAFASEDVRGTTNAWSDGLHTALRSRELKVLARTVREVHGNKTYEGFGPRRLGDNDDDFSVVANFNDDVADSANEVVEVFRLAAKKYDLEKIGV